MGNEKSKSKIIAEIDITEDLINKEIKIISSFEQYKKEYQWNEKYNDSFYYSNEYAINECKIKINKKKL